MPAQFTRLATKTTRTMFNSIAFNSIVFNSNTFNSIAFQNIKHPKITQPNLMLKNFKTDKSHYSNNNHSQKKSNKKYPFMLASMVGATLRQDDDIYNPPLKIKIIESPQFTEKFTEKPKEKSNPVVVFFAVLYVCVLLSFMYLWLPNPYNHTFAACVWVSFLCSLI